jgi:(E)-4-hydroxy-3-methylbut-2-enyl-diphosphate synthase
VPVGSEHPIVKQTMTTTNTRDVSATVAQVGPQTVVPLAWSSCNCFAFTCPLILLFQVMKCADAGADVVRITVQGKKEAEACCEIREQLFKYK